MQDPISEEKPWANESSVYAREARSPTEPLDVWLLLLRMALQAFAFVFLVGIGVSLNYVAASLSSPKVIAVGVLQILGYGLQLFAAVYFIVLAVNIWRAFVQDGDTAPPSQASTPDVAHAR
jgi:hypothetical protein